MERLTKRLDNGEPARDCENCELKQDFECGDILCFERILARVADYEDSGCEPEEVLPKDKADEVALKLMRLADLESLCNYTRLRELAEADRNHQIVIRPCKIGDTVFARLDNNRKYVCECKVKQIVVDNIGFVTFAPIGAPEREYDVSLRGFGKTVFLSREEAEKALQEMEGKKDG